MFLFERQNIEKYNYNYAIEKNNILKFIKNLELKLSLPIYKYLKLNKINEKFRK